MAGRRGCVASAQQSHPGGVVLAHLTPPELSTLTPQPPSHISLPTQPYPLQHHGHPQHMILAGVQQQKLIRRGHQLEMLQQAKLLCDRQDFVDLTIYCEDGVVRAHQMLLAVASPFLKLLFQSSPLYGVEDICLILPETKACLVQALIHFVYTGTVVSREDHFYSLMKLVYALSINASIEAESTTERPTNFSAPLVPLQAVERVCRLPHQTLLPTVPNQLNLSHLSMQQQHQQQSVTAAAAAAVAAITTPTHGPPGSMQQSKMSRYSSGPPSNVLNVPQHTITTSPHQTSNKMPIQLPTQPVPIVNGVTIKNEPQQITAGSYIAIDPNTGLHYKVELPNGQLTGDLGSDPLAAIMHETIFTETSAGGQTTMYTTENGHVIYTTQSATVTVPTMMGNASGSGQHQMDQNDLANSIAQANANNAKQQQQQQQQQQRGKKRKQVQNNKENAVMAESVDDLPCAPDDEDLNTPYACAQCNKTIKGRVMLQAHQYQEHYDNPELSRVDIGDKHACRVCLKLFTRNSDVKAHILRVHCGDRRYPCTMCGKRFKESTHLRKHLYTHTGERPHYCTLCDKGFQTSSDLKRHKRTRVHQERVEQVKGSDETPPSGSGGDQGGDTSNTDFNRWVDEDDDDDELEQSRKQMKNNNVNSTAQALLTNITQPISLVSANGQHHHLETTIDMKMLGQGGASGSPPAPSAVPVTSSWGTEPPSQTSGHYDLKAMSSGNEVDMSTLMSGVTVTTTAASMPNIDGSTVISLQQHQQLLQQHQALQQHSGRGHQLHSGQQQIFIQDHQAHLVGLSNRGGIMTLASSGRGGSKKVGDMKRSMDSPVEDDERLTVVEDDESSSNHVN